ncbi:MAG: SDR family oxidoreductase [Gemmataceae bacterium]
MKRTLHQKRVLLTGASSGIGRALSELLAANGANLVLASRSEDKLIELANELQSRYSVKVIPVEADLTIEEDREKLVHTAQENLGGLDILVNNAGIASWAHFSESTEEILREIMEVNFFAPVELIRQAVPLLTEGEQPAIVNVSSMCGRRAMPAWSEYSASKHALCGITEAFRGEMARFDIDVLLILPGLTNTGLHSHLLKNEGRAKIDFEAGMPPETVAKAIVRAIEKNKTETIVGSDAWWMIWMSKLFPRFVNRMIANRVRKLYSQEKVQAVGTESV